MKYKMTIASSMVFAVLFAAVCMNSGGVPAALADDSPPNFTRTVFMSGLSDPWDLAFEPDGAVLFTEMCRGLSVRMPDGSVRLLFGVAGAALEAEDLFCQGQSGLLGLALDPDFTENRYVYIYMASNKDKTISNRVVGLTLDKDYNTAADRTDIVPDISYKESSNRWGGPGAHSGGRILFSPADGYLYVATGDNHEGPLPQDLTRLGGKVLRIDRDGNAAPGNNTPSGGDPLVAGGNGGWDPAPLGGVSCADNNCGYTSNKPDGTPTPMTDLERFPDALRPSWNNRGDSEGMSPCVFLTGPQWKGWQGLLAVGFLRGARIELLQMDEEYMTKNMTIVSNLPGDRMRSLVQGPDGALYVATDEGEIWRLESDGR